MTEVLPDFQVLKKLRSKMRLIDDTHSSLLAGALNPGDKFLGHKLTFHCKGDIYFYANVHSGINNVELCEQEV